MSLRWGMVVFLTAASASIISADGIAPPVPVARVDLGRYMGLWYEVARLPNRFQRQCACGATARYELGNDGRISVVNRCVDASGRVIQAVGVGKVVDGGANARLKVSFVSFLGLRPFWGDYWILGLGDDYEYAVVGTPKRNYGWILARSARPGPEVLKQAWSVLREQGYDIADFELTPPDTSGSDASRGRQP
jgi:apolipoprotein D and lipocalin family protein